MRETLTKFNEVDAEILAVDPHEHWSAQLLLKESGLPGDALNFPLLTDPSHTVSATYGVAFQMRIHTELSNRPATFIIDTSGVIRFAKRAKTFADRPSAADIRQELQKLR